MRRRKLLVIYIVAFRAKKFFLRALFSFAFPASFLTFLSAYCFLCFDRIQFAFCSEPLISSRLLGFHFSDGFQFVLLTSAVLLSPSFFSGNKFAPNIQECMNFHTHFGANTHPLSLALGRKTNSQSFWAQVKQRGGNKVDFDRKSAFCSEN